MFPILTRISNIAVFINYNLMPYIKHLDHSSKLHSPFCKSHYNTCCYVLLSIRLEKVTSKVHFLYKYVYVSICVRTPECSVCRGQQGASYSLGWKLKAVETSNLSARN